VNNSLLGQVTDSTYRQSQIGVAAGYMGNPTEVAFTDAMAWKL